MKKNKFSKETYAGKERITRDPKFQSYVQYLASLVQSVGQRGGDSPDLTDRYGKRHGEHERPEFIVSNHLQQKGNDRMREEHGYFGGEEYSGPSHKDMMQLLQPASKVRLRQVLDYFVTLGLKHATLQDKYGRIGADVWLEDLLYGELSKRV